MTASSSTYAVGRGKPPLHSRFQKGQSGNPSGKPGPAKLARQRFERALYAALETSEAELEQSKPDNVVAAIARRMALDAAAGRMSAVRQVLTFLDARSAVSSEDNDAEQLFTAAEFISLLQGKNQGSEKTFLEELLWPEECQKPSHVEADARKERSDEPAPTAPERNEAEPLSLVQGKTQGNGKNPAEQICLVSPSTCAQAEPGERREANFAAAPPPMRDALGDRRKSNRYLSSTAGVSMAAAGGP